MRRCVWLTCSRALGRWLTCVRDPHTCTLRHTRTHTTYTRSIRNYWLRASVRWSVGPSVSRQSAKSSKITKKNHAENTRKACWKLERNMRWACKWLACSPHAYLIGSTLAEDLHTLLPPLYLINTILCLTQTAQPAKRSAYMPAISTNLCLVTNWIRACDNLFILRPFYKVFKSSRRLYEVKESNRPLFQTSLL